MGDDGGGGVAVPEKPLVVESREWYLAAYAPENIPTSNHLKLRKLNVSLTHDSIPHQHVGIQLLFISVDPYLRSQMTGRDEGLYLPQLPLNQVVLSFGIGRVVKSNNDNFSEGDIVCNPFYPVAEYCVMPPDFLRKIDPNAGIPLPDYLTSLGIPGFTAWVGIEVLGQPDPGSNVFISAAAGGVGMFAGQLAKLKGCRVIGSTGSHEKVKLLKEEFGYDDAFNYHEETDFDTALKKYFPNGIDLYLDNVGGKMLEAVLNHVNKGAHILLCGMVSQYNTIWTEREGVKNLLNMVGKEVKMEGFLCGSYIHTFGEFTEKMEGYVKAGKIKSRHRINQGVESFLESLTSLFSSSNLGKVIIQLTP